MKRLTNAYSDGTAFISPETVAEVGFKKVTEKLYEYEEAEAKGKLVKTDGFCADCYFLDAIKGGELYARCRKTGTLFRSFELDARRHFCENYMKRGGLTK